MRLEDLDRYRRLANAEFAAGSRCWATEDQRPAMVVAKEDMLWFLRCADLVEEMANQAAPLLR